MECQYSVCLSQMGGGNWPLLNDNIVLMELEKDCTHESVSYNSELQYSLASLHTNEMF